MIQRAEHRDTQAIHAKLDEILHAMGEARNELTKLDEEGGYRAPEINLDADPLCAEAMLVRLKPEPSAKADDRARGAADRGRAEAPQGKAM